jgi:hypothetical protein
VVEEKGVIEVAAGLVVAGTANEVDGEKDIVLVVEVVVLVVGVVVVVVVEKVVVEGVVDEEVAVLMVSRLLSVTDRDR